ncbi:hypothetical protein V8E36_008181 [Tilletia maclaganii]
MAHRVPHKSPVTGKDLPSYYLHASDAYFRDTAGRAVLLRGVNLSGSSKAPLDKPSQESKGFWEDAEAGVLSFVGRPLDLRDGSADVHLQRLKSWGFNSFRYVFTWEALEHEGPGKYDHEFIRYTVDVLRKIKQYGFRVYMDPHQDLFSRFTGGSGAPYWVLPACGMNPRNFTPTQAALIHCEWPSQEDPSPIDFPDMIWATNYTRLAAATLSVLFFAGRDFAPKCIIDDINIQDWLQSHFINAVKELAKAVASADGGDLLDSCIVGWDSMNEPNPTYIGLKALNKLPAHWKLRKGATPTPLQSFITGTGKAQEVEHYIFSSVGPKRQGSVTVDPKGKSIWMTALEDEQKDGSRWGWKRNPQWPLGRCIWAAHGVWNDETDEIINNAYFSKFGGPNGSRAVDFVEDYWLPHWRAYSDALRPIHPEAIMFLQPPVFEPPPKGLTEADLRQRACESCHFYDGLTLITKHWNWFNADAVGLMRGKYLGVPFALRFGYKAIRQCMRDQLGYLRADTLDVLGNYPTIIGEIGIPFDLDQRKTYYGDGKGHGKGDFSAQTAALDASINACDGTNLLSYSLWTYCPDNIHEWGDGWNGEDLSLWGIDDIKQLGAADSKAAQESEQSSGNDIHLAAPSQSALLSESSSSLEQSGMRKSSTFKLDFGTDSATTTNGNKEVTTTGKSQLNLPVLSNGARSAAAFIRPFPVACNGVPVEINFDIKTSEFEFVLEVEEADLGAQQHGSAKIATDREGRAYDDGNVARSSRSSGVLPTEIFLPYIHYAKDGNAAAAMGNFDANSGSNGAGSSRSSANGGGGSKDGRLRGRRRETTQESGNTSLTASSSSLSTSTDAGAGLLGGGGSSSTSTSRSALIASAEPDPIEYDVEVQVSAGTWEIRDQYLYWSLPASAGEVQSVKRVLKQAQLAQEREGGDGGFSTGGGSSRSSSGGRGDDASSYPLSQTAVGDSKRGRDEAVLESTDGPASSTEDIRKDAIPDILPIVTAEGKIRHTIRIVRASGAVRAGWRRRGAPLSSGGSAYPWLSPFLLLRRRKGGVGVVATTAGVSVAASSSVPRQREKKRVNLLIAVLLGFFVLALVLLVVLLATLRHR